MATLAKPFCPECAAKGVKKTFVNNSLRGVHRRFVHGVAGTTSGAVAGRKARAAARARANTKGRKQHEHSTQGRVSKTLTAKSALAVGPEISPDLLFYSVGRTEEFIKGLADQAGVPARQLVSGVAQSLYATTRR